jgi:guanine nucleotide-binding protein G(i) subunit alpha
MYEGSFRIRESRFNVFDVGGQRSERKKWIHCFEGVKAVIYVVAINEYDMFTQEDADKNRLLDSLEVFQDTVASQFLEGSDFILFLNKTDLLREKVATSPLTKCFPEYTGAQTYEEVSQYIASKFEACMFQPSNGQPKKLSIQFTCATAPKTMLEKLFDAMVRIILDAALDEGGFV